MNLLVVCQHYKPEPFRLSDICERLVSEGHKVTVVTGVPNYPEGEIYSGYKLFKNKTEQIGGVTVHRCFTIPRKRGIIFRFLNYYSFAWASTLRLLSLKERFDVVLVNQLSPVMMAQGAIKYAKKHKLNTVLYCLDLWPESLVAGGVAQGSLIYNIFFKISRKIYKNANKILVSSKSFCDYFDNVLNIEGEREYLPQYAEDLFDGIPPVEPHAPPFNLTFAGNVGDMQSVETIIGAARLMKDDPRAVFNIVGDGIALERCKALAKGLDNVVFHGRRPIEDMPEFYKEADAMIVSLKDDPIISYTLPGKVQSYMASARAIIGSINGEAAKVIADANCGVCAPSQDEVALKNQILTLLDNPERFAVYGNHAREYYLSHFEKDAFIKKLINILEQYKK